MEIDQIQMQIEQQDNHLVRVVLSGRLDINSVPTIWEDCLALQKNYQPDKFIIEANQLTYCDSAGIALYQAIHDRQENISKTLEVLGLSSKIKNLMHGIEQQATKFLATEETQQDFFQPIKNTIKNNLQNAYDDVVFLGKLCFQSLNTLVTRKGVRWKDFWLSMENVGPRALPIIILIGFLIGFISTFQSARPMGQFGAQIYMIDLVGRGLMREMGPLMTAVLLAGRTASSFAAEIGTMQINQEIDALKTMGLSPIKFLVIPRILATALMTPILNIFFILFGLLGCAVVMHALGYNLYLFIDRLDTALKLRDFIGGTLKGFAFGIVIASVGCFYGLKTKSGSSAVGISTTQAVVSSLIMIVFVDGLFAFIYYVLRV